MPQTLELRAAALDCLLATDPGAKTLRVAELAAAQRAGAAYLDAGAELAATGPLPGRPLRPELVSPRLVGRRSMATVEGRAMLIHALAHIEFNAVNLALDALWRFPGMPVQYYTDWLRVSEEDEQTGLDLTQHSEMGYAYDRV